jgi:predicted nucleic acid-binding protein
VDRLLDTTGVSALMRLDPTLRAWIDALPPGDAVLTCAITRGEVLYGIRRLPAGQRRQGLETQASRVFTRMRCLPVPEQAADEYARLKVQTVSAGIQLSENDLWIAATATVVGASLVTTDADFARVSGLMVDDWTKSAAR